MSNKNAVHGYYTPEGEVVRIPQDTARFQLINGPISFQTPNSIYSPTVSPASTSFTYALRSDAARLINYSCSPTPSIQFSSPTVEDKATFPGGHPPSSFLVDPEYESYMNTPHASESDAYLNSEPNSTGTLPKQPNPVFAGLQCSPKSQSYEDVSANNAEILNDFPSSHSFSPTNSMQQINIESDDEEASSDEPYAKLIFKALMSAPDNRMVLKEIYQWFELNTDKPNQKSGSEKGWQNSIRHNLSMNGAFQKVEQPATNEDAKRGFVWVLAEEAKIDGVKSTTRYRKTGPNKKFARSDHPAPARQRSGRRGGKAAKRGKTKVGGRPQLSATEPSTTGERDNHLPSTANATGLRKGRHASSLAGESYLDPFLSLDEASVHSLTFNEADQQFTLGTGAMHGASGISVDHPSQNSSLPIGLERHSRNYHYGFGDEEFFDMPMPNVMPIPNLEGSEATYAALQDSWR